MPAQFGLLAVHRHAVSLSDCRIEPPELSIGLYWHERTHRDPMYQWLRESIANCVPGMLTMTDEASQFAPAFDAARFSRTPQ